MRRRLFISAAALMPPLLAIAGANAQAVSPASELWPEDYVIGAWYAYRAKFVGEDGRVVDNVNGNVSHTESQGYAMLLAVAADDRGNFDRIWAWTQANLYIRDDGLAAWRWDPASDPHVQDMNNATDGDLLIAWALLKARIRWGAESHLRSARALVSAITKKLVVETSFGPVLLPGAEGFDAASTEGGPIVNLSYWIFPAIADLGILSADFPSNGLIATGVSLLEKARFGPAQLPANWIALGGGAVKPATGFDAHFGYDAIRIPLYLSWYSGERPDLLQPYGSIWQKGNGTAVQVIDLETGEAIGAMTDPGYHAIVDLVMCSQGALTTAHRIRDFVPTDYYPSTLHLLSLLAMAERYPKCLTDHS